jgi:hypothetical protein
MRNTTDQWLPTSDVRFVVFDEAGEQVGWRHTTVQLAPGATGVVVADAIPLEAGASVARVEVVLDPAPFGPASEAPEPLVVQGATATWERVTGEIVNPGADRASVRVDCAFVREGGLIAGVVSADVGLVRPGSTLFQIPVEHLVRPAGIPTCSAT